MLWLRVPWWMGARGTSGRQLHLGARARFGADPGVAYRLLRERQAEQVRLEDDQRIVMRAVALSGAEHGDQVQSRQSADHHRFRFSHQSSHDGPLAIQYVDLGL